MVAVPATSGIEHFNDLDWPGQGSVLLTSISHHICLRQKYMRLVAVLQTAPDNINHAEWALVIQADASGPQVHAHSEYCHGPTHPNDLRLPVDSESFDPRTVGIHEFEPSDVPRYTDSNLRHLPRGVADIYNTLVPLSVLLSK